MDDDVSFTQMCSELEIEDEDFQLNHEYNHLGIFIEREIRFCFKKDQPFYFDEWMKRARIDAINWILKTSAAWGFHLETAYLSVTYFDRFISTRSFNRKKHWAIQLLSIACLYIAAKMEECNVPCLSEFQLEDYCFKSKVIQRMELFVLTTLEWDMAIITPFVFLIYFITMLCHESQPYNVLYKTIMQIIFTTMKEVNLMDHKPSVIATSATLVALDQKFTIEDVELKIKSIPAEHRRFLELKDVFDCYNLMQRLYMERTRTKRDKLLHTPSSSQILSKPIEMTENSLVNSATMSKRRRLTFDNDKQGHDGNGSDSTKENPKV